MKYFLIVFGTRPEFIKIMPIILEIKKRKLEGHFRLLFTGQHDGLVSNLFASFDVYPDISFELEREEQNLGNDVSQILKNLQDFIDHDNKNIRYIISQGDTTSSFAAAMAAFLNKIPFGHIEAGLRTNDLNNPFPEEYYRKIISMTASIHFAPTINAFNNLINEGIQEHLILKTGNTIVDAVEIIDSKKQNKDGEKLFPIKNNILITCHRKENLNGRFEELLLTVKSLAMYYPDLNFIWILHLNPYVLLNLTKDKVKDFPNIIISEPLDVKALYEIYKSTKIIITDSGGMQEEAVSFGIPAIVIRDLTERNESVELGYSKVTGSSMNLIKEAFSEYLSKEIDFSENPYGDGQSATKIVDFFENLV